jgi:glycosyltransferase involved in cell wall biosynthesis
MEQAPMPMNGKTPRRSRLRIGIVPLTTEWGGGVFQYSQTMLSVLAELRQTRDDDFLVLADHVSSDDSVFEGVEWEIAPLTPPPNRESRVRRGLRGAARQAVPARIRKGLRAVLSRPQPVREPPPVGIPLRRPDVRAWFDSLGLDLVLYPASMPLSFEVGTPYVLAVHDLQHRLQPEFPEVAAGDEFAHREYVFVNGIREATLILTDSDVGREDVLDLYGELIAPERVAVLPFLPATPTTVADEDRERVRREYRLPERFLFYPAQLWPHKNHRRLVEALALAESVHGIEADLVLVGSTSGEIREQTFAELTRRIADLQLESRVHYLGYVPQADMAALFAEAVALVMPTFFGPTNIPILEAWGLDCPVVTSDLRGLREQAGDAAVLADPRSVEAIADAIQRIWLDGELREELARRGRARLGLYTREDYARRLNEILDLASEYVRETPEPARV